MKVKEFITEIDRISAGTYSGGKDELESYRVDGNRPKPLPGGSGFKYYTKKAPGSGSIGIYITDQSGTTIIGKLSLYQYKSFPVKGAYRVSTITTDEEYRGQGLGTALYGIALSILKIPLVSGDSQTPGGRANWVRMAKIAGCEVIGYAKIPDDAFLTRKPQAFNPQYVEKMNKEADTVMDRIMGIGGEYWGKAKTDFGGSYHFFGLPVKVNGGELKNAIAGSNVNLYKDEDQWQDRIDTGLLATWGQHEN